MISRQTGSVYGETCGVSAFAFQGTNAHVLLCQSPANTEDKRNFTERQPVWQQRRWWFAPSAYHMLPSVKASAESADFELRLSFGSLSYLWDHQVMRCQLHCWNYDMTKLVSGNVN